MSMDLYTNVNLKATPTDSAHLVNKGWVEALVSKRIKEAVTVVSTSNLDATYSLADKTLTMDTAAVVTIDGVELAAGMRVLVAGQTDGSQNGIYEVTTAGTTTDAAVLTRASDFDASEKITLNVMIPVSRGIQNHDTTWMLANDETVTLDTTAMVFETYKAPEGLVKKIFTITGDGATTSFPISHGLNSEDVAVQVYDAVTKKKAMFDTVITSANVVTISADVAPAATDSFKVIVVG